MQLPICAIFAWLTIALFFLIPKRLHILDFVFLYCILLILTISIFTLFDVNLHLVTIERTPTISFATIMSRIVTIPLLLMIAVDALQFFEERKPRWLMAAAIWLGLSIFDWVLSFLKVITYHNSFIWHARLTFLMYLGFIVIAWGMVWWFKRFDQKNVRQA